MPASAQQANQAQINENDIVIEGSGNPASSEKISLQFERADIVAFITAIAEITGRSFIVDPRVRGEITVISGSELAPEAIYDVFLSVLDVHGFATVTVGDIIKVIPTQLVKQTPTPTLFGEESTEINDAQITQIYQLKHAQVQEFLPIIRPLIPATSHFAAHNSTNTFIITDTVANVERILNIVRQLDKPNRRSDIHIIFLEHASAQTMAPMLTQLSNTIAIEPGDPALGNVPGGPGGVNNSVKIHADAQSNALIIQAPENEFKVLKGLIDQLDNDQRIESNVHVVRLRFADATTMATLLAGLANQPAAGAPGGAPANNIQAVVQADEQSNSLVIRGSKEQYDELKVIIDELDKRRAQVYVEVIIAEITADKNGAFGINWNLNNGPDLDGQTAITREQVAVQSSLPSSESGVNLNFTNRFIQNLGGNVVPDLQAVLTALRSDSGANILSTPNLLTLDNEEAEIIVGQEVPFLTGSFSNGNAGENNQGDGTVNPFQTIERQEIGLTLRITPQINEGDVISLDINQELSNVSQTNVDGAVDITTDKRSINTKVQVDDGQVIILGGLIRDNVVDTVSWVPILGKIPIIGALFRSKEKRVIKTNLMMFLRPKIIRSPEDVKAVTRNNYDHIKEENKKRHGFGVDLIPDEQVPGLSDFEDIDANDLGEFEPVRAVFNPPRDEALTKGKKRFGHLQTIADEDAINGRR